MDNQAFDIAKLLQDDAGSSLDENKLGSVAKLAKRQLLLERAVSDAEESLKRAKADLRKVQEGELPEAMLAAGLDKIKLSDGTEVDVSESVQSSISRSNTARAYAWLREHGHGSIIKQSLHAQFPQENSARVERLARLLAKIAEAKVEVTESVHAGTLKAWARRQLSEGEEELDEDLFGIFRVRIAKIRPATK